MKEQKIAVIGMGMWGKNIVRNFYNLNALEMVCDLDDDSLKAVQEQFPGVKVTKDFNDIINNKEITGVAVVTPSHTHFKIVKAMLEAGKNVYVEKPAYNVKVEGVGKSQLIDYPEPSFIFSEPCFLDGITLTEYKLFAADKDVKILNLVNIYKMTVLNDFANNV